MSFTLVGSASGSNGGSNATVATGSTIAVSAGDLVVCNVVSESNIALDSVSDGTNNLTVRAKNTGASANVFQNFAWHVSPSGGTFTYTATFNSATITPRIMVYVFTPSATPTLDQVAETAGAFDAGPTSSGNITTTGTDELVFGAAHSENLMSSPTINGSAVTGTVNGGNDASMLSYLAFASTFTGAYSTTFTGSARWCASIISFKIAAAGGSVKRALLLGIG